MHRDSAVQRNAARGSSRLLQPTCVALHLRRRRPPHRSLDQVGVKTSYTTSMTTPHRVTVYDPRAGGAGAFSPAGTVAARGGAVAEPTRPPQPWLPPTPAQNVTYSYDGNGNWQMIERRAATRPPTPPPPINGQHDRRHGRCQLTRNDRAGGATTASADPGAWSARRSGRIEAAQQVSIRNLVHHGPGQYDTCRRPTTAGIRRGSPTVPVRRAGVLDRAASLLDSSDQ